MNNQALQKLEEIKILLKTGQIDYDQAEEMARASLLELNARMEVIAKKFNKKSRLVTFSGFMR